MPTRERLARLSGWRIWMIEHVSDTGPYISDYLHVPDEMDSVRKREQWILSTGIVPEGSRLSWFGPSECQVHVFECASTSHDFETEIRRNTIELNSDLRRWEETILDPPRVSQYLNMADDMPRDRIIPSSADRLNPTCSYAFCTGTTRTCTCHRYHNGEGVEGGQ